MLSKSKRSIRWWHLPVLAAGLLILHYTHVLEPVENLLTRIIQPVQARVYSAVQHQAISNTEDDQYSALSKEELVNEYTQIQERTQQLLIENARLKTVIEESSLLEDQIRFLQEHEYRYLSARITSVSTENISPTIVISKGSEEGVAVGLPVIIEEGVLVGVVTDVQDYASEVRLITNVNSLVSASIQNEDQSPGVVKGEHNLSLVMEFIPQLDTLNVYDSVFTSGADPLIPQGLLIGQVQEIRKEPSSLFQQAVLKPLFQQTELSIVSVILP